MSPRPAAETGLRQNGDDDGGGERTPLLADDSNSGLGLGRSGGGGGGGWRGGGGRDESPDGKRRAPAPTLRAMIQPLSSSSDSLSPKVTSPCCGGVGARAMDAVGLGALRRRLDRYSKEEDDLNIYSLQSIAIVMSYFSIGVALELLYTPIAYYLIDDLGAESGVYTVWVILVTLPWSFKVGYGFLSDCVPIRGLKRKPYMLIGWAVHIASNATLALMGTPGQDWVVVLSFLSACGYLLSDVMTDAIVVEKTKRESMSNMGNMQASGYIARYFGAALGAVGGAVLYNEDTWGWGLSISTLFWINGLIPLVLVIPMMPYLYEEKKPRETGVFRRHTDELWTLVQKRAVWRPMIFVYLYNALMLPNGAWTNYLVETLDFSDWDIGVVNIASQIFAWLGLIVYKQYLGDWTWPSLYFVTTAFSFVFSITQLLLILGISSSWGIPDLLFASGDEAASEVVLGFQFLPLTRMYAVMCPLGSEGTSYALLTTVSNVAYAVAYAIGDLLTDLGGVWSTSNATLESGDMSGMWRLTVLTSCVAVTPICLVWLLPKNKKEQQALQKSSESNARGGEVFLWVAGLSILFTIVEAVWELIYDT